MESCVFEEVSILSYVSAVNKKHTQKPQLPAVPISFKDRIIEKSTIEIKEVFFPTTIEFSSSLLRISPNRCAISSDSMSCAYSEIFNTSQNMQIMGTWRHGVHSVVNWVQYKQFDILVGLFDESVHFFYKQKPLKITLCQGKHFTKSVTFNAGKMIHLWNQFLYYPCKVKQKTSGPYSGLMRLDLSIIEEVAEKALYEITVLNVGDYITPMPLKFVDFVGMDNFIFTINTIGRIRRLEASENGGVAIRSGYCPTSEKLSCGVIGTLRKKQRLIVAGYSKNCGLKVKVALFTVSLSQIAKCFFCPPKRIKFNQILRVSTICRDDLSLLIVACSEAEIYTLICAFERLYFISSAIIQKSEINTIFSLQRDPADQEKSFLIGVYPKYYFKLTINV